MLCGRSVSQSSKGKWRNNEFFYLLLVSLGKDYAFIRYWLEAVDVNACLPFAACDQTKSVSASKAVGHRSLKGTLTAPCKWLQASSIISCAGGRRACLPGWHFVVFGQLSEHTGGRKLRDGSGMAAGAMQPYSLQCLGPVLVQGG